MMVHEYCLFVFEIGDDMFMFFGVFCDVFVVVIGEVVVKLNCSL